MRCLTIVLSLCATPVDGPSRDQLLQLIEASQAINCNDVSFEYEGNDVTPGSGPPDGIRSTFSGSFRRRMDDSTYVNLYCSDRQDERMEHAVVAILRGRSEFSSQWSDEKNSRISISTPKTLEFAGPGNYREIWLADYLKKLARSSYHYESEGTKMLDGVECIVARIRLVIDDKTPAQKTNSLLFWVDLNRGGQVLRFEHRYQGENLGALTTVNLGRFDRGKGQSAWLPISGRVESRLTSEAGKLVYLDQPNHVTTYDLLPITIRFDQGLKDEDFTVNAKLGDFVSDEVRKARYEYGQYMVRGQGEVKVPTDAEIKADLDRMLNDSAVMARELKASSPLREGPGWFSYWPWAIAMASIAGLVSVLYKNRGR